MLKRVLAAALLLGASTLPALAGDSEDMSTAATGFYTAYKKLPASGVPDTAGRNTLAPFLSQGLEKLLGDAAAAEDAFAQTTKGAVPPLLEGDIFTSLFEGATTFKVGSCTAQGKVGTCKAELTYTTPNEKPTVWSDTVYMVDTGAGWRVDDIGYGGSWAFGNKGKLSETLKFAIANANG